MRLFNLLPFLLLLALHVNTLLVGLGLSLFCANSDVDGEGAYFVIFHDALCFNCVKISVQAFFSKSCSYISELFKILDLYCNKLPTVLYLLQHLGSLEMRYFSFI